MNVYELMPGFRSLFSGLERAFGTGEGRWIKRPPQPEDWINHLLGRGAGLGIAPLRPDNTVKFAAIDLDEPDFDAARDMQQYIPGVSWVERSRSGNAHVWVFFKDACPAWLAMGVLKEVTYAAGKKGVEVFPKNHDFARVRLGNYINLPYHGSERPILFSSLDVDAEPPTLEQFVSEATALRNDPRQWHKRAALLMLSPPDERTNSAEFGTQRNLHICAQHVMEHAEDNPVLEGHRNAVYFILSKQLANWEDCDQDEAWDMVKSVNDASPDRVPLRELRRIFENAYRGQYTSTGCDDPLFLPYAHPDCKIAHGG